MDLIADDIIEVIVADLNSRKGFHLDDLPSDILKEIKAKWKEKIEEILWTELGGVE